MAQNFVYIDDQTNLCGSAPLVPNPLVTAGANVVVTPTTDPATGRITYAVAATNDGLISTAVLDPTTYVLTITTTNGDTIPVDLSALNSPDTDVSAVGLAWNPATQELTLSILEDGVTLSDNQTLPTTVAETDLTASTSSNTWALTKVVEPSRVTEHLGAALFANRDHAINPYSLTKVLTNRATGEDGMSNPNGSLGWHSAAVPLADLAMWNGARAFIDVNDVNPVVPDGTYVGQTAVLEVGGTGGFAEIVITGNFRGVVRSTTTHAIDGQTAVTTIMGRQQEQYWMRWNGDAWVVTFTPQMFYGTRWSEGMDGRMLVWGATTVPIGATRTAILPIQLTNDDYVVSFSYVRTDGLATETVHVGTRTQTGFELVNLGPKAQIIEWHVLGGVADYPTL